MSFSDEYLAVAEAYARYRELLDEENLFDFATLQRAAYEMLQADERVRDEVRDRYRHILVDEYQDTNRLQVLILKEIAAPRYELCAVGDDDQAGNRAPPHGESAHGVRRKVAQPPRPAVYA